MTVILPCWIINEELLQLTKSAIESFGKVELIIVDNASPLGGGYLRSVASIYIRNSENLGYAKAVNQGLKLSKTKLTAVANNDIVVSPNWQEIVEEIVKNNIKVGSVHPRMIDYSMPFEYGASSVLTGKERWCTGSFFVLNRNGNGYQLYNEKFLNSYDDWDYFKRIRSAGFYTVYTDKACFRHQHSFSQQFVLERDENNKRNAEIFKEMWGDTAENLFTKEFPDQMKQDYREGFNL